MKSESTGRKRNRGDCATDSQGQLLEYEHGYLRHQAKLARGVRPPREERLRLAADNISPIVVEDCGIELLYVLDFGAVPCAIASDLALEIWWRGTSGTNARLQPLVVSQDTSVPESADAEALAFLYRYRERSDGTRGNRFIIPLEKQSALLELLASVSNVRWSARQSEGAWKLHRLTIHSPDSKTLWSVNFSAADGGMQPAISLSGVSRDIPFEQWQALSAAGWVLADGVLYTIEMHQSYSMLCQWLGNTPPILSTRRASECVRMLTMDGGADLSGLPSYLSVPVENIRPTGRLYVTTARFKHLGEEQLQCTLSFDYAGTIVQDDAKHTERLQAGTRVIERNAEAEEELRQRLFALNFRLVKRTGGDEDPGWKLTPNRLEKAVFALVAEGWEIKASGKDYRRPVSKTYAVSSFGIDWLELDAKLDFGDGITAQMPALLSAIRSGSKCVLLDDGSYGVLPQDWLEHFTILTQIGQSDNKKVLVRQQQAGMIQALLAEQIEDLDGHYQQIIAQMEHENARASSAQFTAPSAFQAVLRPYQQAGAAWLQSLARRGLGGVLADDMGLGKTVEVLALLSARHFDAPNAPSLIIAPSSLLFNWEQEAHRFAPFLRCAQYYGARRQCTQQWFEQYDIVLTTYGTMRQDAVQLSEILFDYIVLDESQNIKNSESSTAQCARILKCAHRIAMTGTPIENHLAELFSQLSFLNPGLFTPQLASALGKESALLHDRETAQRMRHFLQPFILRRRKEQVATDLPAKTEQVICCELPQEQRICYDQLRDYYRQELSGISAGNGTASMLAALLRLRQAACHPALIDSARHDIPSAKLAILHEQLEALLEAGHKALVFSQFTSLLKLAAKDCDASGWKYCYLDGTTKERATLVNAFQTDSTIGIFFISLKAGGVGLNLTAADYVFLLDPWWNPAAEAQAIDRAYRIGQQRPVFAYRIIAKDTVEEKVMLMQQKKRAIANAIIDDTQRALESLPPAITAEDLKALLDIAIS